MKSDTPLVPNPTAVDAVMAKALSPFVALTVAFITAPIIAFATEGKYYIARRPKRSWQNLESIQCCICEHSFEPEDMAGCPAYAGPICSLCCSLDARCHDMCKPHGRIQTQVSESFGKLLPKLLVYARWKLLEAQKPQVIGVEKFPDLRQREFRCRRKQWLDDREPQNGIAMRGRERA